MVEELRKKLYDQKKPTVVIWSLTEKACYCMVQETRISVCWNIWINIKSGGKYCICVLHTGKAGFVRYNTPSLPCFVRIDLSFFSKGVKWLSLLLLFFSFSFNNSLWHHKRMWWHISSVVGDMEGRMIERNNAVLFICQVILGLIL